MLFRKIFRGVSGSVFIRFLSRCLFLVVVASCASESYAQDVPSSPGSETNSVQKIWTRVLDVNQNYLDAIKTYEVEEEVTNISHKRLGSLSSEVRKRISISQFKFHPKSWIEAVEKTKVHLLGKGDPYRTLRYNISDRKKTLSGVDVAKLNPEIGEIESFVQVLYQGEKKYRYAIQDFLSNPTLSAQFKPFFYISSDAPRRLNVPIESSDPLDGYRLLLQEVPELAGKDNIDKAIHDLAKLDIPLTTEVTSAGDLVLRVEMETGTSITTKVFTFKKSEDYLLGELIMSDPKGRMEVEIAWESVDAGSTEKILFPISWTIRLYNLRKELSSLRFAEEGPAYETRVQFRNIRLNADISPEQFELNSLKLRPGLTQISDGIQRREFEVAVKKGTTVRELVEKWIK